MKLLIFFVLISSVLQVKSSAVKENPELSINVITEVISRYKDLLCSIAFVDYNISTACSNQLNVLCKHEDIFIKMIDASSKFPFTGHLYATRWDLGNYDECLSIDYSDGDERILGKYCLLGYMVPDIKNITNLALAYRLSLCQPDKCSLKDFQYLIEEYINDVNITDHLNIDDIVEVANKTCSTKETRSHYTAENISVIGLFSSWVMIMVLSTIYDLYLYLNNIKPTNTYVTAFSVFTNGKKILETSQSHNRIQVLDGLRAISILWVVAGHGFTSWEEYIPAMNAKDVEDFVYKRISSYVVSARLAVDTFFFMSGFLFAYLYLKSRQKSLFSQIKSIPFLYLHRYLRLTPPYAMVFLFAIWIYPKIGSGPLWQYAIDIETDVCKRHWWEYFLYVQNYLNYDELCGIPFWYISADMQMFLLAPLILIPSILLLNKPYGFSISMVILSLLGFFCMGGTIALQLIFPEYDNIYDTHSRLIDYIVGMMMGIFMSKKKNKPFLPMVEKNQLQIANFIIWFLILLGMFIIVLTYQEVYYVHGHVSKAFYFSFARPSWCIGLCWIIYSCYHGYGGFVNWILTRPIFEMISKISYAMYLLHYIVISHYVLSNRSRLYFSNYSEFHLYWGYLAETIISAFIWTLAFDSPTAVIEKAMVTQGRKVNIERDVQEVNNCNGMSISKYVT